VAACCFRRESGSPDSPWGVPRGSCSGNFLLQVYGARRAGARFRPNLDILHPGSCYSSSSPSHHVVAPLVFTDNWNYALVCSFMVHDRSPAEYAKNLMQVPLGPSDAVGVASFPFLAQLYSEASWKK